MLHGAVFSSTGHDSADGRAVRFACVKRFFCVEFDCFRHEVNNRFNALYSMRGVLSMIVRQHTACVNREVDFDQADYLAPCLVHTVGMFFGAH